jgi:hypothetical protein
MKIALRGRAPLAKVLKLLTEILERAKEIEPSTYSLSFYHDPA